VTPIKTVQTVKIFTFVLIKYNDIDITNKNDRRNTFYEYC